tara:strand:- start:221 stop:439 length:219 start_codon:yes stop_codon:yes gene_type:complete
MGEAEKKRENLFNEMDDRISNLEERLKYTAVMLKHLSDLLPDGPDKRTLRSVAEKSIEIAEESVTVEDAGND